MIYQLVYMSKASFVFDAEQLQRLQTTSQRNNEEFGITGLLVFCNGYFIQLLEGIEHHVTSLYSVIKNDSRHTDVTTLLSRNSEKRIAEEWSMGLYLPGSDWPAPSEMREFSLDTCRTLRADSPNVLWSMLYRFISVMREKSV
jgi:hypothetical protein